jgi:hypothetical protein
VFVVGRHVVAVLVLVVVLVAPVVVVAGQLLELVAAEFG